MQQQDCGDSPDCMTEDGNSPLPPKSGQYDKKKKQNNASNPDEGDQGNGHKGQVYKDGKRQANSNWHYDSHKHHRSSHRDSRYKYYYGGFWYLEPYWTLPVYGNDRVSCGEGRGIVRESGFNRVQTMECSGRNYTYMGKRRGVPFRVVLNSWTGNIVSARPM